ncbi:hypothetical protein [uncultured Bacteroides sp.]|uniref:hypothetical protein n=1 Tax=uncultured Bacteroides sp. TaxID=162156 RepID=UPI0025CDF996|nr:hypothetical protein [uncultured Bacteroides sp.]
MTNTSHTFPITLESIALQKAELLEQIHDQKDVMNELARDIFAPLAPATDKASSMMRAFNTGMAVFDGVMLGLKLMRKFRNLFGKRHL